MCNEKEKGVPNMTLLAKPCRSGVIVREDKADEFLNLKNMKNGRKSLHMVKKFGHIVTDKTKEK